MNNRNYDAIIIGSGIGSLTSAAILSRYNRKKVLLIEQSFNPGGQTQSFRSRGGFQWDTGLQYVGEMAQGQLGKTVFDYVTEGTLQWRKITSPYEQFFFPNDSSYAMPDNPELFYKNLLEQFPQEQDALKQYFNHLKMVRNWAMRFFLNGSFSNPLVIFNNIWNVLPNKVAKMTTRDYVDTFFHDETLKSILTAQWGTYGLPPQKSLFAIHAFISYHFLYGAWYPVGGSGEIYKSILPIIEKAGGTCLINTTVSKIVCNSNKEAIGVKAHTHVGKEVTLYAPVIISGIGRAETEELLDPSLKMPFRLKTNNIHPNDYHGTSCVIVYVGFSKNPTDIGLQESNYWISDDINFDDLFKNKEKLLFGVPNHCWLSCPSLKDPKAKKHTAMLVYFIDEGQFSPWNNTEWRKRNSEYKNLKNTIADSLLDFVTLRFPGFKECAELVEVSTPLTFKHFTRKKYGAPYGMPADSTRFIPGKIGPKTGLKNLYISGCDAFCAGIVGSMWGGVSSVAVLNGRFGMFKLLHAMKFNMVKLISDIYFKNTLKF